MVHKMISSDELKSIIIEYCVRAVGQLSTVLERPLRCTKPFRWVQNPEQLPDIL
eukprot:CAMPEP_0114285342 /NCGR_PEP_ID=MMETSP0059-20121206/5128_1 /TAXON_ID=36894 /ORGANISM="Pyramimonas parkeae, Strain CCMP726" /LENGTH=53 /DNA_ID=CAMNT_0001406219 /DNA_START=944 /DNA_END=1108 /DNA_ORIENTATION=+